VFIVVIKKLKKYNDGEGEGFLSCGDGWRWKENPWGRFEKIV